ncbi:uncharacterized protein LOC144436548 isoform X2 [Glandiceps talaboti]
MTGCGECSTGPFSAAAMSMGRNVQERIRRSFQQLIDSIIDRRTEFRVYFGPMGTYCKSHHRIYVRVEDSNRFYGIQLNFVAVNPGEQCVIPECFVSTDPGLHREITEVGTFQGTGEDLYDKVIFVMRSFGRYNRLFNNSLDFAQRYVRSLGIYESIPSTSGRVWLWFKDMGRKLFGHNYPEEETPM